MLIALTGCEEPTRSDPNPDYEQYIAKKNEFKAAFEQCLQQRAGAEQ